MKPVAAVALALVAAGCGGHAVSQSTHQDTMSNTPSYRAGYGFGRVTGNTGWGTIDVCVEDAQNGIIGSFPSPVPNTDWAAWNLGCHRGFESTQ